MSSDLVVSIPHANTDRHVKEDSWMIMWCNTNWGDLLQQLPTSIALFGSMVSIASVTEDFSNAANPPFDWKYTQFPNSFKTRLMQTVNEAFGTAHDSVARIQNSSSQLCQFIKIALHTILRGTPDEAKLHLSDQIRSALDLADECITAAKESQNALERVLELQQQIDQARVNLMASRIASNTATEKLSTQQEQISKSIVELTSLSLINTVLQPQLSKINEFFENLTSLLNVILKPSIRRWARTMEDTVTLGGVTNKDLARHLIYLQMIVPLKASILSEKIAKVYLEVSEHHIMPAQRSVEGIMEPLKDPSKGQVDFDALFQRENELRQRLFSASDGISELVAANQKKFLSSINERLDEVRSDLKDVLPAAT